MISRRSHLPLLSLLLAVLLLALPVGSTRAQGASLSFAGVVVRHAEGQLAYAYVGFTEDEINGIELLRRSGLEVVTVSFGGLGDGVCAIDQTGCPASGCRQRVCQGPGDASPFWQYFRQAAPGEWRALALGGSQTKVRSGDLDGWSWTPKDAGLPGLTLEQVAALAGYDGTSFTGAAAGEPGAVFRRDGFALNDGDTQSPVVYLAGGGVLLLALAGAGVVIVRRRRAVGVEP